MEFATRVDFSPGTEIETWRSLKWRDRIAPGDVIELQKVHHRAPAPHRAFARVVSVAEDLNIPLLIRERIKLLYGDDPVIRVRLLVEPGLSRHHSRYVRWETRLGERRRD